MSSNSLELSEEEMEYINKIEHYDIIVDHSSSKTVEKSFVGLNLINKEKSIVKQNPIPKKYQKFDNKITPEQQNKLLEYNLKNDIRYVILKKKLSNFDNNKNLKYIDDYY